MEQMKTNDFFFWLGADGDIEEVTEREFHEHQENERETERRWRDVDLPIYVYRDNDYDEGN